MSSTLVLIALLASLSMAVILPEMQISKNNTSFNAEYDFMVNKQRKAYLMIGLFAVATFFVSLQTMSLGLFVVHLIFNDDVQVEYDNEEYLKEAV